MQRDSLRSLIRLMATETNPHRLVSLVAADHRLLSEARRLYEQRGAASGAGDAVPRLCRAYHVPLDYFAQRLRLIVSLLNLVPEEEDLYQTLGIERHATHSEIRSAFRRQSLLHHPDRNPEDPEAADRFREVQEAYQTLSNPELRSEYDRRLATPPQWEEEASEPDRVPTRRHWWQRCRSVWQLGFLVFLLLVFSFLVDYQSLLTDHYYANRQKPAVKLPPSPAPFKAPKAELPLPAPRVLSQAAPAAPPPDSSPKHAEVSRPAVPPAEPPTPKLPESPPSPKPTASEARLEPEHSFKEPPGQPVPFHDQPIPAKEPPVVHEAKVIPPEKVAAPEEKPSRKAGKPSAAEIPDSPAQLAETTPTSKKSRRETVDSADPLAHPTTLSAADLDARVQKFLARYVEAYENKKLAALARLFEPDAMENGEPISSVWPVYMTNFQRAEKIRYRFSLSKWTLANDHVTVNGRFHISVQFEGESPVESTGTLRMGLACHGDDLRIQNLNYNFTD